MCSLLLDITASRPFLWTIRKYPVFKKWVHTCISNSHSTPQGSSLSFPIPYLYLPSLSKNTFSKQYQYITHLPYPKTVSKLTPIPLPITNPKSSFSFIVLFVLTIYLQSVKVTWIFFSMWLCYYQFDIYSAPVGSAYSHSILGIHCFPIPFHFVRKSNIYIPEKLQLYKKVYS